VRSLWPLPLPFNTFQLRSFWSAGQFLQTYHGGISSRVYRVQCTRMSAMNFVFVLRDVCKCHCARGVIIIRRKRIKYGIVVQRGRPRLRREARSETRLVRRETGNAALRNADAVRAPRKSRAGRRRSGRRKSRGKSRWWSVESSTATSD